ncbi:DUF6378 domain-containing protein [Saccharopolyspora sp. WRP15-2]|uniref:DUF6378 domain-containing protein n=1 Tax=Saccharopolyspora oryzae TaxID=2997343 RepID=A0ABT4URC5_9PSEU|nr:DUF6378 domain-containing protein [Saccharopolyspora oryzae]MDA3624275.1 DUF6378 domain-containing protein [Saccharopolyspora oryzae]
MRRDTVRQSVLAEASDLIHSDRNAAYGPPMVNFQRIADIWNVLLGEQLTEPITTRQVADLMIATKLARGVEQPRRDNYVDMAGYAACAQECVEEDTDRGLERQYAEAMATGGQIVLNEPYYEDDES